MPRGCHFSIERKYLRDGVGPIAGVDEVGRGPLAGPVAIAAVILDPDNLPAGVDDSKALSPERREQLFAVILRKATSVSLAFASAAEIDALNIRTATLAAMTRAIGGLALRPALALIDGRDEPPNCGCSARAIVGGDASCMSIAAASIIAKVARDRMMTRLHAHYPEYGFAAHVGYATEQHVTAIARVGLSPFHRISFRLRRGLP